MLPLFLLGQAPGCPNIEVADEVVSCNVPCVDLIASYLQTGETTSYDVSSITYAPPFPFTGGTSAFVGVDDIFSELIPLPFDFCFYGNTYNNLVIGANGVISFDASLASPPGCIPFINCVTCNYGYTATIPSSPTTTGPYENAIHGAYHDIDPSVAGDINYAVLGTAPCRTFVVNFSNAAHFNCTSLMTTQQIVIYETTNAIEVYIEDKPTCTTWNDGNALIGIQNIGATQAIAPPTRNTGPWTATNEAWRFTPNGTPNYVVEWFDISGSSLGFGDTLNICTQTQDNYTAEISYTNCNGAVVTESVTNTVFINSAVGQIASLGLIDTIKSCTTPITINADNTMDTYLWNTGETTSSITVNQTGNYVLEATQGGCDGDDTVYVSIVNANIIENNTTICNLETFDLNIEESNIIVNWSTTETTDNIIVSPSINTEYWVEISDGVTICKDSIQIDVNQLPIVSLGNDSIIPCRTSIIITPATSNGSTPYTFLWNDGSIENNITVEEGNISVTVTDGNGCTDNDNVSIVQNVAPTAIISGGGSICENETSTINFNFNGLLPWNLTYSQGSINTTINNINSINYSISTSIAGIHNILLAEDINSCNADIDGDDYVEIIINPLPNPIISPGFYEIYAGEEVLLSVGNYAYYWWYSVSDSLLSENEYLVADSSLITYIIVEDDKGCIGSSENAIVNYIPRVELYIPNTFTPNGDEHNDLLVTIGNKIEIFNMIMTNRWGDVVYTTNNINKYWDGKFKGVAVAQGVYSYQVDIIGKDKRRFNTTGQVHVIY